MKRRLPYANKQLGEDGFSLVAILILSVFLVGMMIWYSQWIRIKNVGVVNRLGSRNALDYAESTIDMAMNALRSPTFMAADGSTATLTMANLDHGRAEAHLVKDIANSSLVDAYATGYYYLGAGTVIDQGNPAQYAVVHAKIRLSAANSFFAAVPGNLSISYGANIEHGSVYARNLTFKKDIVGSSTTIAKAFYTDHVYRSDTGAEDGSPPFVHFTEVSTCAVKLPAPLNLSALGDSIRQYYLSHNTTDPTPDFSGTVGVPSGSPPNVYFVNGDLNIGSNGPLSVSGAYVIYVTGAVHIHNNILMADSDPDLSWVAILAEGNIVIDADSPPDVTLYGTYMTNGAFQADPSSSKGNLTFVGGFLAHAGAELAATSSGVPIFSGTKTYTYRTSNNANIVLPNYTTLISYRVIRGKFSQ